MPSSMPNVASPRLSQSRSQGSGTGLILRLLCLLAGFGMVIAAFGLWLVPGVGYSADFALIKLGTSLFLLICGMCALVYGRGGQL